MDRVEAYRAYIRQFLSEVAAYDSSDDEVEHQLIFDTANDHYLLFHTGWKGNRRVHGAAIHIDIKNGKIWIQDNRTEIDVANELVALGVRKEDIVLGLYDPYTRQFTEFAVG
jgi:hypothetical protein